MDLNIIIIEFDHTSIFLILSLDLQTPEVTLQELRWLGILKSVASAGTSRMLSAPVFKTHLTACNVAGGAYFGSDKHVFAEVAEHESDGIVAISLDATRVLQINVTLHNGGRPLQEQVTAGSFCNGQMMDHVMLLFLMKEGRMRGHTQLTSEGVFRRLA